jgi:RNA polymerase sigma factor (sigma-70 family)
MSVDTRHHLLTPAEELALSRRIELGDLKAKEEMIESNLGLVYFIARRYAGRGVPFEDLVQEGTVGLVRAVDKFDRSRGVRFSTYAVTWIRHALIDALGQARTIRVPKRAAELNGAPRVTASLDEQVGEEGAFLRELVADPDPVDPWRHVDERETIRQMWSMLRTLPQRHRIVLIRRYGLDGEGAQSHAEIGRALGVGEERSRQLEREALRRLRELGGGPQYAA